MCEMAKRRDVINRGWKESLMGDAFGLMHEGREGAEFQKAKELDERGELFASFTSKKNAKLAEYLLGQHREHHLGQHEGECVHDLLGASLDRPECHVPVPDTQERAVAVVAEGAKEPVDLEDDDDEEEEAEVAFAVLVEQGKEVAAEASRASSSI